MKITIVLAFSLLAFMVCGQTSSPAVELTCAGNDAVCREFALFTETSHFERIIERVDPMKTYSDAARGFIGQAYLMLAGKEGNSAAQEEQFCRKALEYGSTSAYMGLYFIYAGQDTEAALGYLKQYVATKPADPVPYMLLGESELEKKNYKAANSYLREAKKIERGRSANLDWMLFQVSYILGDYAYAFAVLDDVMNNGQFLNEFKALVSDPRFKGMMKRPEFKKYDTLVTETASLTRS